MSLIVDALRRAQEGTTRHLPPFSGHSMRRPLPGLGGPDEVGRIGHIIVVSIVVIAVVGIGAVGVRLARGSFGRAVPSSSPPRLVVVEPVVPPNATPPPSNPSGEVGTSSADARAALLAAQPLETNETKAQESAAATVRTSPTRSVNPRRSIARRPVRRPAPRNDAGAASTSTGPPPIPSALAGPAAIVKVFVDPAVEAAEALAAGLRDQQLGQTAKAIDAYRRGIQADPRNPGLFNNLGVALRESGQLDEAITAFRAALDVDPKYEKALNNLGVSRYQKGQYEEAIDLFKQSLRINPTNVESYVNTGIIYFLAERWDEALNAFQQALRYDPRSAEAHYNLGLLWERHGDSEKALRDYRKFVELAGPERAQLAARVSEHLRQMERSR